MTWMVATIELMLRCDLGEHSISVPFSPIVTLETARVDIRGRVPLAESLETLNEMPIGGYDSIVIGSIDTVVYETPLNATSFSTSGTVTVHLRIVAFVVHLNNNCSSEQAATVLWGRSSEIILSCPLSEIIGIDL